MAETRQVTQARFGPHEAEPSVLAPCPRMPSGWAPPSHQESSPGVPRAPDGRPGGSVSTHTCTPSSEPASSLWVHRVVEAAWGQGQADAVKEKVAYTWAESQAGSVVTLPGAHLSCLVDLGDRPGVSLLCLGRGSRKPLGLESPAPGRDSQCISSARRRPCRGWQRPGLGQPLSVRRGQFGLEHSPLTHPPPRPPGRHQGCSRLPPSSL